MFASIETPFVLLQEPSWRNRIKKLISVLVCTPTISAEARAELPAINQLNLLAYREPAFASVHRGYHRSSVNSWRLHPLKFLEVSHCASLEKILGYSLTYQPFSAS